MLHVARMTHNILQPAVGHPGFRSTSASKGTPWKPPSALKSQAQATPSTLAQQPPRRPLADLYADAALRAKERLQHPRSSIVVHDPSVHLRSGSTANPVTGTSAALSCNMPPTVATNINGDRRPHTAPVTAARKPPDRSEALHCKRKRQQLRKTRTPIFRTLSPPQRAQEDVLRPASAFASAQASPRRSVRTSSRAKDSTLPTLCANDDNNGGIITSRSLSRDQDARPATAPCPVYERALRMDRCPDPPPSLSLIRMNSRFSPWRPVQTALSPSRIPDNFYLSPSLCKTPKIAARARPGRGSGNGTPSTGVTRGSQMMRLWTFLATEHRRQQQMESRASEQVAQMREISRRMERSIKTLNRTLDLSKELTSPKRRTNVFDLRFFATAEQEDEGDFFANIEVSPEERMMRDLSKNYNVHIDKVEQLYDMFAKYDADGTGCIDQQELVNLLTDFQDGNAPRPEYVALAMLELDQDRSGLIEFTEFFCWVREQL